MRISWVDRAMVIPLAFSGSVSPSSFFYSAGAHLQRTGDTIAPSALSCFIALSTSLRSRPLSSAILPAFRGWPASFIVANTFSFVSIIVRFFVDDIFILLLSGKTIGVRNYRFIGHPLLFCLLYSRQIDRTAMILCQRASLTVVFLLRTSAKFKQA